jgi:hypothetical protein
MAGVHAGKVLTPNLGPGPLRGNFEYAVEVFPFWQSYTPKFQRPFCTNPPGTPPVCTPLYTVGGTFTESPSPPSFSVGTSSAPPLLLLGPGRRRPHLDQPQIPRLGGHPTTLKTAPTPTPASSISPRRAVSASTTSCVPALHRLQRQRRSSPAPPWRPQPGVNASVQSPWVTRGG